LSTTRDSFVWGRLGGPRQRGLHPDCSHPSRRCDSPSRHCSSPSRLRIQPTLQLPLEDCTLAPLPLQTFATISEAAAASFTAVIEAAKPIFDVDATDVPLTLFLPDDNAMQAGRPGPRVTWLGVRKVHMRPTPASPSFGLSYVLLAAMATCERLP